MGDLADRPGEKMCGGVQMLARTGFRLLLLVKEIGSVEMKKRAGGKVKSASWGMFA